MRTSIIIPNYNGEGTLRATLRSIMSQKPRDSEMILVDDASTDGSVRLVRREFPSIKIITNAVNKGACTTRNTGISAARGEKIVLIDSDVILERGALAKLLSSETDITYPTIRYPNKLLMYPAIPAHRKYLLISPIFVITKRALSRIDKPYFDPTYRIYGEDTDFFLRCYLAGLSCKHERRAVAIHNVQKKGGREGRYYLEIRNGWYGFTKFCGRNLGGLDHAFKLRNIAKVMACGVFNYNLFDEQSRGHSKNVSTTAKARRLLGGHNKMSERGRIRLIALTAKASAESVTLIRQAWKKRKSMRLAETRTYETRRK